MKTDRHPRWTDAEIIAAIRERATTLGIKPGEFAPLSGQLGAAICNAAHKRFGGKDQACAAAGYVPNGKGGARAKKIRDAKSGKEVPGYTPPPTKPAIVRDPVLAAEREAHLERMRKKYAKEPPPLKLPKHLRERTCHIVRWDRTEDYLPPDDLIRPKRAA